MASVNRYFRRARKTLVGASRAVQERLASKQEAPAAMPQEPSKPPPVLKPLTPDDVKKGLYQAGAKALAAGEFRRAEYHLWEMVRLAPQAPTSTFILGVAILCQGRVVEARRIIDRAYRLKMSINDNVEVPGRDAMLRAVVEAAPDWAWPRYQLLRDAHEPRRPLVLATLMHRLVIRSATERRFDDVQSLLGTDLRADGVDVVRTPYRTMPVTDRVNVLQHLEQAGLLWLFDSDDVVAVRADVMRANVPGAPARSPS